MVQNVNPTFVKTPNVSSVLISTGTTQNSYMTVYQGGTNGSKITSVVACAVNTTAAFDVRLALINNSVGYYIGTNSVAVSAGILSTVPLVNLLNPANAPGLPVDSDGNPYILLASTAWVLACNSAATSSQWAANAQIGVTATGGDF